jgi:hypothetical protein
MTPGFYVITQTSTRFFQLQGYSEAGAREAFASARPKKGRVVQLVRFVSHFRWYIVEQKHQ